MKREFDSEPVCGYRSITTKIRLYGGATNTNFHGKKIPKENVHCVFLSLILLESAE